MRTKPSLSAIFMLKFQQNIPFFLYLGLQNARCCAIVCHNLLFQVISVYTSILSDGEKLEPMI